MTIEQIVPEQIPSDVAGLKEIKQKAYSKPYLEKKMDTEMIQTKKAKQASSKTIRVHLLFLKKLWRGNAI